MDQALLPSLSPSERRTLEYIGEGEFRATELDWVALQGLKRMGFCDDGSLDGPSLQPRVGACCAN